jgi:hypothetical protein
MTTATTETPRAEAMVGGADPGLGVGLGVGVMGTGVLAVGVGPFGVGLTPEVGVGVATCVPVTMRVPIIVG